MNSTPPPLPSTGSSFPWRIGCIVALVLFVCLIIAAVLGARYAIVKTAFPFKAFAAFIEKANPNVKITGISGDLATGPRVESITWGMDPKKRSEILDLRVKYNGFRDARVNNRVIIEDVGVRKAHIDLADFGTITRTTTSTSTSTSTPSSSSRSNTSPLATTLDRFEIKRVLIEDVLITNRNTDFRLSVPKISWTGFVATPKSIEPGEVIIESDRLSLHSGPGQTLPIADQSVTFQKAITGTAQPLLHNAIRQPISFALNFTIVPEVHVPAFHFTTADGKLEIATTADGGQALRANGLDLGAWLDFTKIYGAQAADIPSNLVLDAVAPPEDGPVKILGGRFRVGTAAFEILPTEFTSDQGVTAKLEAVWKSDAGEIRWTLPLANALKDYRPRLSSPTDLPPTEILARVFAGKPYGELTTEERRAIDLRIPIYFAPEPQ